MSCEEIKELLSSYIDKELTVAQEKLVEAHLLDCRDCAAALARLQQVVGAFADMPQLKLPEAAADRLAAAIDARLAAGQETTPVWRTPRRRWFAHPAFVSVAASVAAAAIAVFFWKAPAQTNKSNIMLQTPAGQAAPEGRKNRKPQDTWGVSAPDAATRKAINVQLDQAVAGALPGMDYGNANKRTQKTPADEDLGVSDSAVDARDMEEAAKIAANNAPARILNSVSARYGGQPAWIVLVERTDKPGYFIGAIVGQKDGRVLYRSTRPRP